MVNFGFNSASLLGFVLIFAGAGLYFLRSIRPEIAKDQDIFFAAVGLLCGGILVWYGWRLDPILQFGQFLLTGSTIFFGFEAIRLRGITTQQAKRNTQIVDEERPVSKVYRAEVYRNEGVNRRLQPYEDDEEELEDNPRLRGYAEPRTSTRTSRRSNYDASESRSTNRNRSNYERYDPRETNPPATRSTRSNTPSNVRAERPKSREKYYDQSNQYDQPNQYDQWDDDVDSIEETGSTYSYSRGAGSTRRENQSPPSRNRPTRKPATPNYDQQDDDDITTDYVEYQPLDESDDPSDWNDASSTEYSQKPSQDQNPRHDSRINFDY